jgi:hypothetical protein
MSAPQAKTVPLLDVHRLAMLLDATLTCTEPRTFSLITFCNSPCARLKHCVYATCMYVCIYVRMYACVYMYVLMYIYKLTLIF